MGNRTTYKPESRPTSIDVARAAGVSRSTVSLVFNNIGGSRVSANTRERVIKAARDLGYRPDQVASTLRKGYSDEIAVLAIEAPTASVTAQSLAALQERARELGYSLGTHYLYTFSEEAMHSVISSMLARHPVGIIASIPFFTRKDWLFAKSMGVQAVILQGLEPAEYAPTLVIPVKQALYTAGKYLLGIGHKHIARVSPRDPLPMEKFANKLIQEGLRSSVDELGGSLTEFQMNLSFADAYATVDVLLSSPDHPTAIIGDRDEYCFFLLKALSARGILVPRDIAVVGINDSPFCELSNPSLTSVGFDIQGAGSHAIEAIDAIVQGSEPSPELLVFPPPRLNVRESS